MFPSSAASSSIGPTDPRKHPGHHHLYVIQLVEGPPPPPRRIPAAPAPAPAVSSPPSSPASSCPSTSDDDDDDDDEDASSYCSSIVTPDESTHAPMPWTDDTYSTRMKRVHAWASATAPPQPRPPTLKRKTNPHHPDDDTLSHTSKRSRSRDGRAISRLTGVPCPACDALFPSLSSLRKHGCAPNIPEACRVAVEYNFE